MTVNPTRTGTERPLVSVIIPYYKQQAFVAETIRSVDDQFYPNIEIVVVDDGSPVPAHDVLGNRENVLILRTENRGAAAARNFGFESSSGQYLIFLDSDDRLTPGAIEAHLTAFADHPEAGLIFGAARIIDEQNRELHAPHICRPRKNYFLFLFEGNPIACPGAAMLRRKAFIEAGGFDEVFYKRFPNAEDYHLYLRLARRYPFVQHGLCVADYRLHKTSKSQNKTRVLNATLAALHELAEQTTLSHTERARLRYGREKITHMFDRQTTVRHRVKTLYYKAKSLWDVCWQAI